MPRGTRHCITGTLRRTRFGHALELDGGGVWQIDAPWSAVRRYCNQRVTIEGTRSGFNLLDVHRIEPRDQATADQPHRRHLLATIDGRTREALTSSYEWIRVMIRGSPFH
ncbi:MAG TPA: DUF5818 domain-containing protein [Sphingomonas sp.]|uniref:DUF5818 domain-containing protein n=1 Tax=Sphingomonas sp. TaxID=28214 RepID=UPI002ED9279F